MCVPDGFPTWLVNLSFTYKDVAKFAVYIEQNNKSVPGACDWLGVVQVLLVYYVVLYDMIQGGSLYRYDGTQSQQTTPYYVAAQQEYTDYNQGSYTGKERSHLLPQPIYLL